MGRRPPRDVVVPAPAPHPRLGAIEMRVERLVVGVRTSEGTATIRLAGDLDAASGPHLVRVTLRLVRAGNPHVVVGCEELTSCDPAGAEALSSLRRMPELRSLVMTGAEEELGPGFAADAAVAPAPSDGRRAPASTAGRST